MSSKPKKIISISEKPVEQLVSSDVGERLAAVKEITNIFRLERLVYLTIVATGLVILLVAAIVALVKGEFDNVSKFITGGSGGLICVGALFLIRMWNRSLDLVLKAGEESRK